MRKCTSAIYDARFSKPNPFEEERKRAFERENQYGSDLAPRSDILPALKGGASCYGLSPEVL